MIAMNQSCIVILTGDTQNYPPYFPCLSMILAIFFNKQDLNYLIILLQKHYKISASYSGKIYCRLIMEWNYKEGYVDVSVLGYVDKLLQKFQHPRPASPQLSPHKWTKPIIGANISYTATPDISPKLD